MHFHGKNHNLRTTMGLMLFQHCQVQFEIASAQRASGWSRSGPALASKDNKGVAG
jgi:hypothetical protein